MAQLGQESVKSMGVLIWKFFPINKFLEPAVRIELTTP